MKILLVGDLRPAQNYGAYATSDTLLNLLRTSLQPDDQLKTIDSRYIFAHAPVEGFREDKGKEPSGATRILRRGIGYAALAILSATKYYSFFYHFHLACITEKGLKKGTHLPSLLSEYAPYFEKVMRGKLLPYERKAIEWADVVVINVEGSMVRGTDAWGRYRTGALYFLFIAYLAQRLGKKTAMINHTIDPDNQDAINIMRHVYKKLDFVSLREPLSIEKIKSLEIECSPEYIPDALFSFEIDPNWAPAKGLEKKIDFSKPFICIGDSATLNPINPVVQWNVYDVYEEIIKNIRTTHSQIVFIDGFDGTHPGLNALCKKENIPSLRFSNCSYQNLIGVLGKASCFVSGRWHASIMAALSGTPFILCGSDSHKTRALTKMYTYPFSFYDLRTLPLHIDELCKDVETACLKEEEFRKANLVTTKTLQNLVVSRFSEKSGWIGEKK